MDERDVSIFVRMLLETDEIASRRREFGIDERSWRSSRAIRDLLLMPLIQIGELSTHLRGKGLLQRFPSVPWREIRGFRNIVVHGYGSIDIDIAWQSATVGVGTHSVLCCIHTIAWNVILASAIVKTAIVFKLDACVCAVCK